MYRALLLSNPQEIMKSKPGTYALLIRSQTTSETQVGRWGVLGIEPGYYVYVGSAFGPGGVRARVLRHCAANKPKHWHIDYLREFVNPVGAWFTHVPNRVEHQWAAILCSMQSMSAIKDFGCSDCKCYSHLFVTASKPDFSQFASIVGDDVEFWSYQIND